MSFPIETMMILTFFFKEILLDTKLVDNSHTFYFKNIVNLKSELREIFKNYEKRNRILQLFNNINWVWSKISIKNTISWYGIDFEIY